MTLVGFSEYEGRKPETVELLGEEVDIKLLNPDEEHPDISRLDFYHAARIRNGSAEDYRTAIDSGIPTVHNPGWLELWNKRYGASELLEESGANVPSYELWDDIEDAETSELNSPVVLQPNSHRGQGRHDTEVVSREDIENSDLLGEQTYASEFIQHDTLHKIYRVGDNIRPVKFENHRSLCDQREAEMSYPQVRDWMNDLAQNVDAVTGETLWSVDLVEGEKGGRYAVDLNMVTSTNRMEDGPQIYAEYILEMIEDLEIP